MKVFSKLEEMQPYYNENTNTYEFIENQKIIDVEFNFYLNIDRNIIAGNIDAKNIDALNIIAKDINAWNIIADNINAWDITAANLTAGNIDACNITAWDITAENIKALNIKFYAVCFAYETFVCNTVKGIRENAKYFCLDSDVAINKKED